MRVVRRVLLWVVAGVLVGLVLAGAVVKALLVAELWWSLW